MRELEKTDRITFDEQKDLVFSSAKAIHTALCSLSPFSNGRLEFAVSVAKKDIPKIASRSIGKGNKRLKDISHGYTFLAKNNLETPLYRPPEERHGTIVVDDLVIGVHSSKEEMDLPIAIGIAYRTGLKNYQEAENFARELQCIGMYAQYEAALTGL